MGMSHPPPRSVPPPSGRRSRRRAGDSTVSSKGTPKRRKAAAHESATPRTLASLALASGTGEDVAALSDRGPRPRFRLEGRALRAVLIACLAVLGAVWVSLAFAQSDEPALRDESGIRAARATEASPRASAQPESGPDETEIVVYISGHVNEPGVYTLASPARVNDAVEAAHGLAADADHEAINLAAPLEDGEHVHVPAPGEVAASGQTGAEGGEGGLVNINSAGSEQLQQLPGIGPKLAESIVQWRETNGAFSSVDNLLNVPGIGDGKLEQLREFATV